MMTTGEVFGRVVGMSLGLLVVIFARPLAWVLNYWEVRDGVR